MTAAFDFGAFPPEVNSAKMYAGPGSAPMLAAATAWDGLASELRSHANDYDSIIANLTGEGWQGPASTAMASAAAPYTAWMNTTAAQAEQTAGQATAAAAAYEAAYGMTVPPPVIAANRAQLASLVATNVLGQNGPAIAATEAHYGQMWAQDAAAMYGYAAQSSSASTVPSFTTAPPTTAPGATPGHWGQYAGYVVAVDFCGAQHAAGHGVAFDVHAVCALGTRGSAEWRLVRQLPARQLLDCLGAERQLLEHVDVDRCDQSVAGRPAFHRRQFPRARHRGGK